MKADDISVKEFPDMMSVYCYSFRDGPLPIESRPAEKVACIKHIFTGPYEDLKDQATSLFLQIQEGIELGWQNVTTGVAEGTLTYLICSASPYTASTLLRPVLLLGIAPPRLGRQRDSTMHSPSTKAHLQVRQQLR